MNCATYDLSRRPGSPCGSRLARTVPNLALSLASVGLLMECSEVASPWALAAKREGRHTRQSGTGVQVKGRYNAYWRGQNLVHPDKLADWGCEHARLAGLARSPLFGTFQGGGPIDGLLRDRDAMDFDPLQLALRYNSWAADCMDIEAALPRVAAMGTWEAVEYLWNAVAILAIEEQEELDFDCAGYLPSAIALWACRPSGARAGPLLWALMRKYLLDSQCVGGSRLRWENVDLMALIASARRVAPAKIVREQSQFVPVTRMEVPIETLKWIERSRPELGRGPAPKIGQIGALQLESLLVGLHESAWTIIRREFGQGALPVPVGRRRCMRNLGMDVMLRPLF